MDELWELYINLPESRESKIYHSRLSYYYFYKFAFEKEDGLESAARCLLSFLYTVNDRASLVYLMSQFETFNLFDAKLRLEFVYNKNSSPTIRLESLADYVALVMSIAQNEFNENLIRYLK